jgi:hypothetical protein
VGFKMKDNVKAKGLKVAKSVLPGADWKWYYTAQCWYCEIDEETVYCLLNDGTWMFDAEISNILEPLEPSEAKKFFKSKITSWQDALRRPKEVKSDKD